MHAEQTLDRFIAAQKNDYPTALKEIQEGRKKTHWMWYIFPQISGLGYSDMAKFYGIKDLHEAQDYLAHPVLGKRLLTISNALLELPGDDAMQIFGSPDHMKLHSSMTLFAALPGAPDTFGAVLNKFFDGRKDDKTLKIIKE